MDAGSRADPAGAEPLTRVERSSALELAVTRDVAAPARLVFEAWTRPDLFTRWWTPKSFGISIISHAADIRTGGAYRLVLGHPSSEQEMAFFGRYIEVTPPCRLVWTNDEAGDAGSVTTVSFEERGGATRIVVHERYPSTEALDDAMASGSTSCWSEQFEQLDDLLAVLDGNAAQGAA